jgi:hypothetical protein
MKNPAPNPETVSAWLGLGLMLVLFPPIQGQPSPSRNDEFLLGNTRCRLSGPYRQANLTVFLIHGRDTLTGKNALTLQEALQRNKAIVHETGEVNQLSIENQSREDDIFIQAGEIIKGGMQDRAIAMDLILPPRSGKVPITVWCVEAGRMHRRGKEDDTRFNSATTVLATRELKLAAMYSGDSLVFHPGSRRGLAGFRVGGGIPVEEGFQGGGFQGFQGFHGGLLSFQGGGFQGDIGGLGGLAGLGGLGGGIGGFGGGGFQGQVWAKVSSTQKLLGKSLGKPVIPASSHTSLQLTLEEKAVGETVADYNTPLSRILANKADVIGFAYAVNGKMSGADVYASAALFKKLWPKLLHASAVEAIAERKKEKSAPVSVNDVRAFLTEAIARPVYVNAVNRRIQMLERESEHTLLFETRDSACQKLIIHRCYLARPPDEKPGKVSDEDPEA